MSVEENKALIHRWVEGINKHDPEVDELISDVCVLHGPGMQDIKGQEGVRQMFIAYFAVLPDVHYTVDDMVAEGDKVAVRITATATHKGEYMGIAPTGKQITIKLTYFYRLAGGKIVEGFPYSDSLALFQQLGVSPPGH